MKILLISALALGLAIPSMAQAISPEVDLGGITDFMGDMLKQARGATLINGRKALGGALYVPVWTFHDATGTNYVHLGGGGRVFEGGNYAPIAIMAVNLPALSGRLWNFAWAQSHVSRLKTPDIWFGPYIEAPGLSAGPWVIGDKIGVLISIGLGKR